MFFKENIIHFLYAAEFWTKICILFKPSPALVHFTLTHFHWFWDLVNNSFLQDIFMRFVLTGVWNLNLNYLTALAEDLFVYRQNFDGVIKSILPLTVCALLGQR